MRHIHDVCWIMYMAVYKAIYMAVYKISCLLFFYYSIHMSTFKYFWTFCFTTFLQSYASKHFQLLYAIV
jgi:hypothetical protein